VLPSALLMLLFPTASPRAAQARDANVDVTLISFGSLQGDVQICGCHLGPKGGMARRAAYLDALTAKGSAFLQLDLGDFSSIKEGISEFETRFAWEMMEKLKVQATAAGARELTMWPVVRDLAGKSTIPIVSSNVSVREGGKEAPVGKEVQVLETKGVRVALFSLLGPEEFQSIPAENAASFVLADPFETARRLIPELHRQADLVVLLSQMSTAETDSLIRLVPGIDVALYGHEAEFEDDATRLASTVVNRTGVRGQYVGNLTLTVDPQGKIVSFRSANIPLAKTMPEDAAIAKRVEETVAKVQKLQDDDRAKRQAEFEKKMLGTGT
jgi:5'-nucleotidase / UDP-sugar diphosphatase